MKASGIYRGLRAPTGRLVHQRASSQRIASSTAGAPVLHVYSLEQRRRSHSSPRKASSKNAGSHGHPSSGDFSPSQGHREFSYAPLSMLPLSMILLSLCTSTLSSSSLLPLSLRILAALAHSRNPLLSPDHNPLLRYLLKKSLYAQFCAGENASEVRSTIAQLKAIGFTGVILAYAKETSLEAPADSLESTQQGEETELTIARDIVSWTETTLETVRMAEPGDFVAFKFSGAGRLALYQLSHRLPPSPCMNKSMDEICQLAHERGVRLLFDGERDTLQAGIDAWTIQFASKYNTTPGKATVFGTYQAYKKSMREVLSRHLAEAQKDDFTLGIKLVRGAYLGSDLRNLFYSSKADTDACYDNSAASVLTRQWNSTIEGAGHFPHVSLMLATHNASSVRRAYIICNAGDAKSEVFFAQLQGMADEIGCELVELNQSTRDEGDTTAASALPVYKYMAWGTTGECMKYLLRRAQENRDAIDRTRDDRDAMCAELVRRMKTLFHRV